MNKIKLFLFAILLLTACSSEEKIKVQYAGALRTIMHDGNISSKINLKQFANTEHLFALGAVENLKGEIIVIDSESIISTVKDSALKIGNTFNLGASLLVYSQVRNWQEFSIPIAIIDLQNFENFLVNTAKSNNNDTGSPLPFLIKGKVKYAEWHVIDWVVGDKIHTHEKHKNSGLRGTIENENVIILGFYSDSHKGIFTHKSSNLHMHIVNEGKTIAGHLDEFNPGNGALFLPIE